MEIKLEDIKKMREYRRKINGLDLNDLKLFSNGIELDKNSYGISMEDFRFTGLANIDFIYMIQDGSKLEIINE